MPSVFGGASVDFPQLGFVAVGTVRPGVGPQVDSLAGVQRAEGIHGNQPVGMAAPGVIPVRLGPPVTDVGLVLGHRVVLKVAEMIGGGGAVEEQQRDREEGSRRGLDH